MTRTHFIALAQSPNGAAVLLATAADIDALKAAVAAECVTAGIEVDEDELRTVEVYLTDIDYEYLIPECRSGDHGHLRVGDEDFAYAYDAAEVRERAADWLKREGEEAARLLYNLGYHTPFSGNVNNDHMIPVRDATADPIAVLDYERAFDLFAVAERRAEEYRHGGDCEPDHADVLTMMEKAGDTDRISVLDGPFSTMVAAIAAEVAHPVAREVEDDSDEVRDFDDAEDEGLDDDVE